MFEFKKLCDTFEKMSVAERELLLMKKSAVVLAKFQHFFVSDLCATDILVGFIIGSVIADGHINETEYLLIYPALARVFGDDFDFISIKESFQCHPDQKKVLADYHQKMVHILSFMDDELKQDVITLCLCITSVDGKISLKEKKYICRLCEA